MRGHKLTLFPMTAEDRDEKAHFCPAGRALSSAQRKEDSRGRPGGYLCLPGLVGDSSKSTRRQGQDPEGPRPRNGSIIFKERFLVAQTGLELVIYARMIFNFEFFCSHLLNARIKGKNNQNRLN